MFTDPNQNTTIVEYECGNKRNTSTGYTPDSCPICSAPIKSSNEEYCKHDVQV